MRDLNVKEKELCLQLLNAETPLNYFFEHLSWDLGNLVMRIEYNENRQNGKVKMMFADLDFTNMLAKFDGGSMFEIIRQVVVTINLIKLLESQGLIITYRSALTAGVMDIGSKPVRNENLFFNFTDDKIAELILEYADKQVIITDEFRTFVKNGYITRSEYRERRNERIANKAFWASIFAVTISVLALANDLGYLPKMNGDEATNRESSNDNKKNDVNGDTLQFPRPAEFHPNYKPLTK